MTPTDPAAPAAQDANRQPQLPYQVVLAGQPALVTGANSGIGKAIAVGLARAGADVVVNYVVDPASADEVVAEIEALGRRAIAIKADVSREDEVTAMFDQAVKAFGTLHIVVSNAGLQRDAPYEQMTLDQWNTVIGVNLTGQFLCTRAAVREFTRRGLDESVSMAAGKILCMSSVHQQISVGRTRQLRRVEGRRRHADAQPRPGGRASAHPGQQHRPWRHPYAHQHRSLEHAQGLCRPDDARTVQADRRAGRHRPRGGVGLRPTRPIT